MKVGQYELGKTIGRGAFSKVKIAIHVETNKEYVVKIISKTGAANKTPQDVKQEVKGEISIMKRLAHDNIVKMYEVMESCNHYFIVLESVMGGDLCDHIMTEGKLGETIAKKYVRHLVEGLRACHLAGVAHRDIKPENCLISKDGVLKVADFGLSRLHKGRIDTLDEKEFATDSVGTLSYAAPEVLNGPYNAFKADLWSVGVVVFVMLTGKFPFGSKGYTDSQIREDIRKGKINRFPSSLSEESKDLILALIRVEADTRLSIEGILKHVWVPQATPEEAKKSRPEAIDIARVQLEAKEGQHHAIEDTMSPAWADSPAAGQRDKFRPPLFSPANRDDEAGSPTSRDKPTNIATLKDLIQQEGRRLGY
ncbi:CBL-interacting serine/threonine-protein kinase 24 [Diplonema papillatum]|nr:CBL-interacting serine/threonine-protein kinase 24 [Diplonema papillatum]|eukprot:gene18219-28067_t